MQEFTSAPGTDAGLLLGAAMHYQVPDAGSGGPTMLWWTADISAQLSGGNFFAAVVGTEVWSGAGRMNQLGFVVQGGYSPVDGWEGFARYEWADLDAGGPQLSILTVGFTRFFSGHQLKLSNDVGYGFNPVGPGFRVAGADWRTDLPGRSGQFVIRSQLQLIY